MKSRTRVLHHITMIATTFIVLRLLLLCHLFTITSVPYKHDPVTTNVTRSRHTAVIETHGALN